MKSAVPSVPFDIHQYDFYIVLFSGGKDSTASFLRLLDLGIPTTKIELWHHLVDGKGGHLMDWECTEDYCRQFARAFKIPVYFSWKDGGFEAELLRNNQPTRPVFFETPDGVRQAGGNGPLNTRRLFPQLSANLSLRWCSAYLKIDVGKSSIIHQERFAGKRVLIVSGERAQESPSRKHYQFFEPDITDNRNGKKVIRLIDRCRIVHNWTEEQIWDIIQRYRIQVHPAYYLGYARCSCKWCIFANPDQFATSNYLSPEQGKKLCKYEKDFGRTIRQGLPLNILIDKGQIFPYVYNMPEMARQSISSKYYLPIFTDNWVLPAGAYQSHHGPT